MTRPKAAPSKVFWITLTRPEGFKKRYRDTGGGLFSRRQAAVDRGEYAIHAGRAVSYEIFEADLSWVTSK